MDNDEQLVAEAKAFVDDVWEDVVADIDYLVQVESVEDKEHAQKGMPFGPASYEALRRALSVAEKLGLEPHDCEGYIGYADLRGDVDAYLATIAHSDIVPLGQGWSFDPLRVTRRDGYLVGRGVLDDKGPLVLSLYAAHYFARRVKRTGVRLPYTLRCIVGTNEETGMEDVDYYLQRFPEPAFCFTPDAVFPLICGEKGRFFAEVASPAMSIDNLRIVSMEGGTVANAIPGHAEAVVVADASELAACDGIIVEKQGTGEDGRPLARIVATGKGGHASMPEGTRNAIGMLVRYLVKHGICDEAVRGFFEFEQLLLADTAGKALGIDATDDTFDPLTCVGGTIHTEREGKCVRFVQTMDIRYPKSTTGECLHAAIGEAARRCGCELRQSDDSIPFFISPDSEEIKTLERTYNEFTDRDARAFTIGGGTYARHFTRAVAFGPDDPAYPNPEWVGIEHGPDEGVSEDGLKRALAIYIVSIARLMRLSY